MLDIVARQMHLQKQSGICVRVVRASDVGLSAIEGGAESARSEGEDERGANGNYKHQLSWQ